MTSAFPPGGCGRRQWQRLAAATAAFQLSVDMNDWRPEMISAISNGGIRATHPFFGSTPNPLQTQAIFNQFRWRQCAVEQGRSGRYGGSAAIAKDVLSDGTASLWWGYSSEPTARQRGRPPPQNRGRCEIARLQTTHPYLKVTFVALAFCPSTVRTMSTAPRPANDCGRGPTFTWSSPA